MKFRKKKGGRAEGRAGIIEKVGENGSLPLYHLFLRGIYMRGNKVGGENCGKLGKIYTCFVWPVQEMHAFNLTACTSVLAYKLCFQVLE